MKYTITAFAENRPGVLYRIADLFLRRKVNIESMTVSETEREGVSRFTILVDTDKNIVEKITKQLYRIIEVIKVFENEDKDLVMKEITLIKIFANNLAKRQEIENLTRLFNAKIIHVAKDFLVVEKTGNEEEIVSLFTLLKPFGIKEFVRSGRIAVLKENNQLLKVTRSNPQL
jgi:acetolactate synthase-1/3 small subunit